MTRYSRWGEIDAPSYRSHSENKGHYAVFTRAGTTAGPTASEKGKYARYLREMREPEQVPCTTPGELHMIEDVMPHQVDVYFEGTEDEHQSV